jgi:cell division protein FtsN
MSNDGIRNLDQLQEEEEAAMPRSVTLALVALGGACVVFGAVALVGRSSDPKPAKVDPLGELVSSRRALTQTPQMPQTSAAGAGAGPSPADLSPADVTFPRTLSDDPQTTTALALVRPGFHAVEAAENVPVPDKPPPATDRLAVMPLPAQAVLEASPVVTRPRDPLTRAASQAAQLVGPVGPVGGAAASAGSEGGYQLQVSSFRTQEEGDTFANQLRARGHKAYVLEAHVPGRGTWFRVRIGPFATQHAAAQYRTAFESKEHVVPFLVPPDTTARAR